MTPLIVRLLLDARSDFLDVANPIRLDAPSARADSLNHPAWVIAHTASGYDATVGCDARGRTRSDRDPWLQDWARRQEAASNTADTSLDDARSALHRAFDRTTEFLEGLTDGDLDRPLDPVVERRQRPGETVGYLLAHSVAHLYTHASELNVIGVSMGLAEHGFPGKLKRTRGES